MATTQNIHPLTPTSNTTPVVVNATNELSGSQWVSRFPTSVAITDLTATFQSSVNNFISALTTAGINHAIAATYRPKERAFLMHYAYKVSRGSVTPNDVPIMAGVNIEWDHGDIAKSKAAASAMVSGYGIVYAPALESRHTEQRAIDMSITNFSEKSIVDAKNNTIKIKKMSDLFPVGATYGLIKLVSDPPHWSDDGR